MYREPLIDHRAGPARDRSPSSSDYTCGPPAMLLLPPDQYTPVPPVYPRGQPIERACLVALLAGDGDVAATGTAMLIMLVR